MRKVHTEMNVLFSNNFFKKMFYVDSFLKIANFILLLSTVHESSIFTVCLVAYLFRRALGKGL